MTKPYSFNQDQMNGIVEEIYSNIIKECEKLKEETNCPNEQVVALLSVCLLYTSDAADDW